MAQQLAEMPGPTEPGVRNTTVSVLDVSPLTPLVRALLRERGRLTAVEAAEFYGPSRLPRTYSVAEARELVGALERLGIAARAEEAALEWRAAADEPPPEVVQHPGVREQAS